MIYIKAVADKRDKYTKPRVFVEQPDALIQDGVIYFMCSLYFILFCILFVGRF